jgi:hypothetical protein
VSTLQAVEVFVEHRTEDSVQFSVGVDGTAFALWFRSSVPLFLERSDALIPLALIAAMSTRAPLVIPGVVSPRLLANLPRLQDILAGFSDGALAPTSVAAQPAAAAGVSAGGVGSFFTAGVDSFYTALERHHEISHLVYVHGFDVFHSASDRAAAATNAVHAAAAGLGKDLIEVETNLRELTDSFAPWLLAHGSALAVVALMLQRHLGRVLIPSTFAYRDLFPLGSHPLLDPLWGTETLEIVHDGCEANRVEKIVAIASSDLALRHLRVCPRQHATYNCGACNKCVGTMVSLRLAGALGRCSTLPGPVTVRRVVTTPLAGSGRNANWRENLRSARNAKDRKMVFALTLALRPRPFLAVRHALGRIRRSAFHGRLARAR